jgi:hypothetical protein
VGVDIGLRSRSGGRLNLRAQVSPPAVDATEMLRVACRHLDDHEQQRYVVVQRFARIATNFRQCLADGGHHLTRHLEAQHVTARRFVSKVTGVAAGAMA